MLYGSGIYRSADRNYIRKNGIDVSGVDINPKVVEMTNRGKIHIVEPALQELCAEVVANGKLKAYTQPVVSDAYFIVVPTPFKGNHEPDISYVESATKMVIPLLKEGDLFVIESTSPRRNYRQNDVPHLRGKTRT